MAEPAMRYYQDRRREELHDGRIVAMAGHSANHDIVFQNLISIFKSLLRGRKCKLAADGFLLHLSDKDKFFPDLMIVCNPNIYRTDGVYGAPDLIVEILSPSTMRRDRGYKKNIYEKHGVKEYWLVSTDSRSIEVYLLKDGQFVYDTTYVSITDDLVPNLVTEEERDSMPAKFATSIFPDLMLSVDEIFEGLI